MNRGKIKRQLLLMGICVTGACAAASADTSVRALPPAGIVANAPAAPAPTPQRDVAVVKPKLDEFDSQRVALNATHVESAEQIDSNLQVLNGNVVDAEGRIMGVMAQNAQKIVLLQLHQGMLSLRVPEALETSAFLSPGATVRILANVHAVADAPTQLSLLNIDAPSSSVEIAKVPDTSAVVLPPLAGTIDALPAPPDELEETTNTPSYEAVAQTAPPEKKEAPRKSAPSAPADVEAVVKSQKAAYVQMISNTNKKLKSAQANEIAEAIIRAGLKYQMDPRFLAAIIGVESDYDIYCLSSSGAMGLGQLMPFNLKEAGVKDAWNPTQNVFGTARLLRGHLDDYKDRPNGTLLAVAAYNAGPGAVRRAGYKVPNGAQVRRYVWKVYYRYKALAPDMF